MLLPEDFGIQLICPDCRRPLARIDHYYLCSDGECRRAYAIVDQIPKLLVDDSEVCLPMCGRPACHPFPTPRTDTRA